MCLGRGSEIALDPQMELLRPQLKPNSAPRGKVRRLMNLGQSRQITEESSSRFFAPDPLNLGQGCNDSGSNLLISDSLAPCRNSVLAMQWVVTTRQSGAGAKSNGCGLPTRPLRLAQPPNLSVGFVARPRVRWL
jgi:hypothetical protein